MLLAMIFAAASTLATIAPASAAVSDWQKGASVYPTWDGDFGSDAFRQSLGNLRATGANEVTLVVPFAQSNVGSTDIQRRSFTPTDDALRSAIDAAHGMGMHVNLMPHLDPLDDKWRIYINPSDRDAWFNAYESTVLFPLARIAQEKGVEMLTLGVELGGMTMRSSNGSNDWHWRETIRKVREIYKGALTYSAQHDDPNEKADISWWDAVDDIGISAYHPAIGWNDHPSVDELRDAWKQWYDSAVKPLADRFGKPVIFPEIGFKSTVGGHKIPAAYWVNNGYDGQGQANAYEAIFQAFQDEPSFKGLQLWDWRSDPHAGGEGDQSFTPQHKPAEETMRRWFGGGTVALQSSSSVSSSSSSVSSASSVSSVSSASSASSTPRSPQGEVGSDSSRSFSSAQVSSLTPSSSSSSSRQIVRLPRDFATLRIGDLLRRLAFRFQRFRTLPLATAASMTFADTR